MSISKYSSGTGVIYLGDHIILADGSKYINGATQITNKYYNFSGKESSAQGTAFKSDGTKLYLVGEGSKEVQQYTLSTAWDLGNQGANVTWDKSKSVLDSGSVPNCIFFKPDGTIMYILQYSNRRVRQYNLSTAWDIGNATLDAQKQSPEIAQESTGLWFGQGGKYMYILSRKDSKIYRHTLSTARDTSTAGSSTQSYTFGTTTNYGSYHNLWFNKKGTQMFTTKRGDDKIEIYKLRKPWDLTTMTIVNSINVNSIDSDPMNLGISGNSQYLYMSGYSNKTIYQFETSGCCYEGYEPTNHTMLYCPFNGDIQDKTGHFTITSGSRHSSYSYTPSYLTLDSGLKVLTIATVGAYLQTSAGLSMPWKTVMIWYYKGTNLGDPRNNEWKQIFGDDTNDASGFKFRTVSNGDSNPRAFGQIGSTATENAAASNTWHHLALTTSGGNTCRYYLDGQYKGDVNAQYSPTGNNLWRGTSPVDANKTYYTLFGYVSETILEDIQRSDNDIAKYVNNIKHLYGLS